jgi:hypothetical protein
MKTNKSTPIGFVCMLVFVSFLGLDACSAPVALDLAQPTTPAQAAEDLVKYKEYTLPSPEAITFELPENWDFWANAGYLSPDNGKTYAGVRMAWIKEGQDAEALLYNEGSRVHDQTTVMVGDLETHRYIVEVTLTSAATNEVILHNYEMIYAFPAPKGEMMTGVVFAASTAEEVESLTPIAEHMVASLKWNNDK